MNNLESEARITVSNYLKLLWCVTTLTLTTAASAASLTCNGTVDRVAYHQGSTLYVKLNSMNQLVGICRVDVDWEPPGSLVGSTSPASCKTLYATLLAARHAGSYVSLLFDATSLPGSCSTFSPWTNVNVRWLEQ